jgi:hypothetical protein
MSFLVSRVAIGLRLAAAFFLLCLLMATALGMMKSTAPDRLVPQASSLQRQSGEPAAISFRMAGHPGKEAARR